MIRAAITPGTQPQIVNRVVMINDPHPLSSTANGGKTIANITLNTLIILSLLVLIKRIAVMVSFELSTSPRD